VPGEPEGFARGEWIVDRRLLEQGYSGGGYDRGPREMFSATCSSCGREAQVPFRPSGDKPVYCSDCFQTQRRSY